VLLWPDVSRAHAALVDGGCEPMLAWQRAADAVLGPFCRRVAVPRRISLVSQDIWALQQWLPQRNRRRVTRVLAHPRFRAAWDFLVLRAQVEPELEELVDWWRQAQSLDDTSLVEHIVTTEDASGGGEGAPARRKRRRRGGRRGGGAPQGADA
jgi:poly(A) polymerase